MLMTETNTQAMYRKVMQAARFRLGPGRYQADFEHGQWWVTRLKDGAQWSVVDCEGDAPQNRYQMFSAQTKRVAYLDFEQVTRGDED